MLILPLIISSLITGRTASLPPGPGELTPALACGLTGDAQFGRMNECDCVILFQSLGFPVSPTGIINPKKSFPSIGQSRHLSV